MNLKLTPTTSQQLAARLHLTPVDAGGNEPVAAPWGVARLIRQEVRRNSIATRRELRKTLEPMLEMAGCGDNCWKQILHMAGELVDVGELIALQVDHQTGYAAAQPRWLKLGDNAAVVLGPVDVTSLLPAPGDPLQFLRRFDPQDSTLVAELESAGIEQQSIAGWLGEPAWQRLTTAAPSPTNLRELWSWQQIQVQEHGSPFNSTGSQMRIVAGAPGKFFGSRDSLDGRWRNPGSVPPGCYAGVQPGYNEHHWRPLIASIAPGGSHSLLLNAANEADPWELFNWLVLARSFAENNREIIRLTPDSIQCTFPAPRQLQRLLKLIGEPAGAWKYRNPGDSIARSLIEDHFPEIEVT